jgi:hypothetical protein
MKRCFVLAPTHDKRMQRKLGVCWSSFSLFLLLRVCCVINPKEGKTVKTKYLHIAFVFFFMTENVKKKKNFQKRNKLSKV